MQTFLRDGQWLTMDQIQQYNKKKNQPFKVEEVKKEEVVVSSSKKETMDNSETIKAVNKKINK